jgi:TIR domain
MSELGKVQTFWSGVVCKTTELRRSDARELDAMETNTTRIFISYSHENEIWLTEYTDPRKNVKNPKYLLDFWERSLRGKNVEFWFDREEKQGIHGGDQWRSRIFEEIDKSDIAILLITQDFIISPFIRDEELPHIMDRSMQGKIEILPILLEPARWKDLEINNTYQLTPGKPTPLSEYLETSENDWKKVRLEVVEAIENVIAKVERKRKRSTTKEIKIEDRSDKREKGDSDQKENSDVRSKGTASTQGLSQADRDKVKLEPVRQPVTPDRVQQPVVKKTEVHPGSGGASTNSDHFLFAKNAISFLVGDRDSKVYSFCYIAGTAVRYAQEVTDGSWTGYQLPRVGESDIWLPKNQLSGIDGDDKRTFFKISETGQVGYLVDIWEDWKWFHSSIERINIDDNLLGVVEIKIDQITSMTAKKDEMQVQTKESGNFTGALQKLGNYQCSSFTMGPCLVTCDGVIALARTTRLHPLTLTRLVDAEKPPLISERVYWDRSQLKFRLPARSAAGHFDERVRDRYIQFAEQTIGWMRISIPQIRRLTVDSSHTQGPVVVETFAGNVYRGTCKDEFNLSGTMISFDKVKDRLDIEPFDREDTNA